MKNLIGAAFLAAVILAVSACGGGHGAIDGGDMQSRTSSVSAPPGARISSETVSSSRLILGGRVRCTATATTPVQAGQGLAIRFVLRNVSKGSVKVALGSWLVVRSASGTTYDTRVPYRSFPGGPAVFPTPISAGATKTVQGQEIPVRWRGPLRVTPGCEDSALPVLHVGVVAPGPLPDDRTAVAEVDAAMGPLFDQCRPWTAGVAVRGQIDSPNWSAPPMGAKCSVSIERTGDFLVAEALVLIPPDLHGVRVWRPYEQPLVPRKTDPPYEAMVWQFVVTKNGATSVAGATRDATKAGGNRMAPSWGLIGSRAGQGHPSTSRCGYQGFYGLPSIDFISVCPS
jgi:hypothetical protein